MFDKNSYISFYDEEEIETEIAEPETETNPEDEDLVEDDESWEENIE